MGQIGLPLCQNDSAGRGGDDDADSRDSSPERLVVSHTVNKNGFPA